MLRDRCFGRLVISDAGTLRAFVQAVHVVPLASTLVGYAGGAYLIYRAGLAMLRVHRARHAYPAETPSETPSEWQQRCRGALLGHAIGDAVNLPAENLPRWLTRLRYPSGPGIRRGVLRFIRKAGDVSDDTQLTIAVSRSIVEDGSYSHERFIEELAAWSRFRVGAGRASSVAATRASRDRTSRTGAPSEGNGVAIRVTPLAIALAAQDDATLSSVVARNGRVTHESDAAIHAATFIALLTREALTRPRGALMSSVGLLDAIRHAQSSSGLTFSLPPLHPIDSDEQLARVLRRTGTSGHVYQCIPAVTAILLRHRLDYHAAMRAVFTSGGDTDSIGAMVGAVIGAQLGANGLPSEWVQAVQHRGYLCALADQLATRGPSERLRSACTRRDEAGSIDPSG